MRYVFLNLFLLFLVIPPIRDSDFIVEAHDKIAHFHWEPSEQASSYMIYKCNNFNHELICKVKKVQISTRNKSLTLAKTTTSKL